MSLSSRDCAREVMEAVLPAVWFIRRQMRGHRGELTLPQFRILVRIRREPEASLSSLADHLGASLSTVSRAVTSLVDKGLLTRTDSPVDRRQLSLSITPQGQRVLDQARQAAQLQMADLFEPLPLEQRHQLVQAMQLVRHLFTGDVEPAEGLGYLHPAGNETPRGTDASNPLNGTLSPLPHGPAAAVK